MLHTPPKTSLQLLQPPHESAKSQRPRRSQFRLLATHFIQQILSLGATGEEPEIGVTGLLAILAVPGVFFSLLLFEKYSPFLRLLRGGPLHIDAYRISLPDKYVFVVCSMALTAIIMAVKWERILPGPLDFAVLAPLPIRLRTIFLSNAAALAFLAALFAIDLNAVPAVLFPVVVLSGENTGPVAILRFMVVHGLCVTLASLFAFAICLALLGALMSLVPASLFHRMSLLVRLAIVFLSCLLLATVPQVPALMLRPSSQNSMLKWLPPAWYVALYQCMQGHGTPQLQSLATLGLTALLVAVCIATFGMVFSYRRCFLRVPNTAKARPVRSIPIRSLVNRLFLRNGFDRALYWFALRILLRSEAHTVAFGAFVTLGVVLASADRNIFSGSLSMVYLMLIGFRMTLEIPAGPKAAWVYRICSIPSDPRPVLRKLTTTLLLLIVAVPTAIIVAINHGPELALLHAFFLFTLGVLLSDGMLMKFRRTPFLSELPKFQNRTILLIALSVLAFLIFTALGARLEMLMLRHQRSFVVLPVALVTWRGVVSYMQKDEPTDDAEVSDDIVVQKLLID